MDTRARYKAIVREIVHDYAQGRPSHGAIDIEVVIDPERDHYQVIHIGWDRQRRVHGTVLHLDIINDKIWIQYDGTDRPVADELLAAGVPADQIVLGFHPENVRQYTGFAVN